MMITIINSNDDEIFFYNFLSHQSPISFRSIQDSPPVDACDSWKYGCGDPWVVGQKPWNPMEPHWYMDVQYLQECAIGPDCHNMP